MSKSVGDKLGGLIATGLGLAVVFSVLAHGAVEPWSVLVLRWLVLALAVLWALKACAERELTLAVPTFVWPMVAWLGLGVAQSVVWGHAGGDRQSLSLDVDATRETALTLCVLILAAVMAANFLTGARRLRAFAWFLVFFGLTLALFAFVQHFTWNGAYYWLRPAAEGAHQPGDLFLFGPYRNHNHFAGYMELLFPLPIALVLSRAAGVYRFLFGFAAFMIGIAAVGAMSRGGMLALAAEVVFLAAMSLRLGGVGRTGGRAAERTASRAWRAGGVMAIGVTVLGGIVWLAPEAIVERVTHGQLTSDDPQVETFFASRGWMWRDAFEVFRANPIIGTGLGTFATAYPIYSLSNGSLALKQAHNDYLQLLAESGLVGGALAVWFMALVLRSARRGAASREPWRAGVALGGGAALVGLMAHSVFDFNLQLPANALLFLILAAVSSCGEVVERTERAKAQYGLRTAQGGSRLRFEV